MAASRQINLNIDLVPLEDLLVRKALAHEPGHGRDRQDRLGPHCGPCEGLDIPPRPMPQPGRRLSALRPGLARQALATSSYGSVDNLPPLMIDLIRPDEVDMGRLIGAYWQDNLGVDLEVRERNDPLSERRLGFVSGVDLETHELSRKFQSSVQLHSHHRGIVDSRSVSDRQQPATLLLLFSNRLPQPESHPLRLPTVLLALFHYANSLL